MTEVPVVVSASMFLDRRLLHVCDPDWADSLFDVGMPSPGRMLSAAAHGCLIIAEREADVIVQAQVHDQRPDDASERECASFEVLGGVLLITNPLWAGPPGEIRLDVVSGHWCLDVHQQRLDDGEPLTLRFWPGSSYV